MGGCATTCQSLKEIDHEIKSHEIQSKENNKNQQDDTSSI